MVVWGFVFFFSSAFTSSSLMEEKGGEKRTDKPVTPSSVPFVLDSEANGNMGIRKRSFEKSQH